MSATAQTVVVVGGLAESLLNFRGPLLAAMVARGHRVIACAPDDDPATVAGLTRLGVVYRRLPLQRTGLNPLADLRAIQAFTALYRELQPDVVLHYTIKPVIYGSLAARKLGLRRSYSMITGLGYVFQGDGWRRTLLRRGVSWLYRRGLAGNAKVFFQNPDDQALFTELGLVHSSQCLRIYGSGVHLQHFQPQPRPAQLRFLLIARLLTDKGIREYAQAARLLKQSHPQVECALAGWLDSNPAAIRQQELDGWIADGSINFLGRLQDVRPALANCSVYVLPSYREGTPRTVLEAMAMGRAIITTDAPGCRETVVNGDNGWLVPVQDAHSLYQAMCRFIDAPELVNTMGERSLNLVRRLYDVHSVNATILSAMQL